MTREPIGYLGIDAGGSKTLVMIADRHGHLLGVGRAGPGNWESVGLDGAFACYAQGVAEALHSAGIPRSQLAAAGYALAGVDWPSDERRLAGVVEQLDIPGPRIIVNDTLAALRAGSHDGTGVVVICGTGSTVAGRAPDGTSFRTFGLGPLWGDHGGAGGLVFAALRALALQHYGRLPATTLAPRLLDALGAADVLELAERISREEIPQPGGELAHLVIAAAADGDTVACSIVREAGAELGANAAAVAQRLGLHTGACEVVLAGGVLTAGCAPLLAAFDAALHQTAPQARSLVLASPPALGSVLLALDAAGIPADMAVRQRLAGEIRAWLG